MIIKNLLSSKFIIKNINSQLVKIKFLHFSKIIQLKLGDLGEGTKEATIKQWYKKEGDHIEEEEKVVEVYTDKLVAEIPSPTKGKISKLNYKVEESCLVGKSLCEILIEETDNVSSLKTQTPDVSTIQKPCKIKEEKSSSTSSEESEEELDDSKSTPAVRHLIKSHKLDHRLITPSGRNNRIIKGDVLKFIETQKSQNAQAERPRGVPVAEQIQLKTNEEDKVVKITGFQKAMTKSMTQATLIPSFLFTDEHNVDGLIKIRKDMISLPGNKIKLTYTPFFIKAISMALNEFPIVNSFINSNVGADGYIYEYTIKKDHNISIAIDGPEGLVVPNIKRVQDKSVIEIQRELISLREKTEKRRLTSDDLRDGTITVSNIGNVGGKVVSPIIMPPQSCIVGISKFFDTVSLIPRNSETAKESNAYFNIEGNNNLGVAIQKSVNICISADHRIIDGATIARFSQFVKLHIEHPLKLLIQ